MNSKFVGVAFAVMLVAVAGLSLAYELNIPEVHAFKLPPVPSDAKIYRDVTLYAEEPGWDANLGPAKTNPTLVFQVGTVVNFTVIEEDTLPHTLAINPGPKELSNADIVLSIGPPQYSVVHGQAYFNKIGVYTYWCTVHPLTMVGLIYVNKTVSTSYSLPKLPANYPVNYSQTLTINSNGIANRSKGLDPTLYYPTGSAVNFTITQNTTTNASFNIAYGSNVSSYNETALNATQLGRTPGKSASFIAYLKSPGEYTYWDQYNVADTVGHIYVANNSLKRSLQVTNGGIKLSGHARFQLPIVNSTNAVFTLNDSSHIYYNFSISGYSFETLNISGNRSISFNFSFIQPASLLFNQIKPVSHSNSIYVYLYMVNVSVNATLTGYVIDGIVNQNLQFTQYTVVNFTLNNTDSLNNTIAINPGNAENSSSSIIVAYTPSSVSSASGYFYFVEAGNYTMWDTYHPSSNVLLITVISFGGSAGSALSVRFSSIDGSISGIQLMSADVMSCPSKTY